MQAAFICDGVRTPIGRYGGALSTVRTDDLAAVPVRDLLRRHPALAEQVDDTFLGCANQAGEDNRNVARMAVLLAGLPARVPGVTLNRLCGSGLEAVGTAARAIASGDLAVALAGGVESMSRAPFVMPKAAAAFSRHGEIHDTTIGWRLVNEAMERAYGTDSMPQTAQNVADEHGISRADQDAFALRSQQRATSAQAQDVHAQSIVSVRVQGLRGTEQVVSRDEHPRADTTLEALGRLRAVVRADGSVTAGNSSGVNDGAAALVVASEQGAARAGLKPVARVLGMASAGVQPRVMGLGPIPAVAKLCERLGLTPRDFDLIELNEAFAAQALACTRHWGLPDDAEHLNPHGGAIALGHPLGMSGARLALAAATELQRRQGRYALVTMCVGVGQGIALALERAD